VGAHFQFGCERPVRPGFSVERRICCKPSLGYRIAAEFQAGLHIPYLNGDATMGQAILAEFGAAISLTAASLIAYTILLLINRQQKLRFFGISSRSPQLTVYLSRLVVERATGVEEKAYGHRVTHGYRGPAVQKLEFDGAIMVRDLLKAGRVPVLPDSIRKRLGQLFIPIAPIEPDIDVSPAELHEVGTLRQNVISLGSQVYNSLFCKHNEQSRHFRFEKHDGVRRVVVTIGGDDKLVLSRDQPKRDIGIIERVNDPSVPRTVFYCAGLGAGATMGSVRYLVDHWKELFEENGLDEFALYLIFPGQPWERSEVEDVVPPEKPVYVKRGKRRRWV
jgi:hypothetical protein